MLRILTVLLLAAVSGLAQTSGTISGFARDPSGAAVANLRVIVTNERTGAAREAESDATGFYQVLALTSGTYTIDAEGAGFKRFRNTGVILRVDENIRADISLQLGQVSESIEVTAEAALIDTRSSQTTATIDDRRIVDLPLAGRNVFRLAATLPGVLNVVAPDNSDMNDTRSGPRMNVNGGRPNQNYNRFNGTYFNNPSRNTGMNVPPPDAVQEFRIQTSTFSADSGRNPGANVTIVSRQGTNEFHGTLWEFHRNDNLNARSFFQARRPQLIQNQFGAAVGGPIKRNKAFIFGTYEGTRDRRQASEVNALLPSAAERAGDFSALTTRQLVNPRDNTPFANNRIPSSLFDPASVGLLRLLPAGEGRIQALGPAQRDAELFMLRHDLVLTQNQTLFAHYYLNQTSVTESELAYASNISGWTGRTRGPRAQNAGINHTWTINPTLLNQLTLGFTRSFSLDEPTVTRTPADLGIQGMPMYTNGGSPQFNVAGRFNLASGGPVKFASNTYQIQNMVSKVLGNHTLKVGFEFLDLGFFQSFLGPPQFTFNGQRTGAGLATRGDPLADFMLGAYQQIGVTNGVRNNDGLANFYAGFIQDDWKFSPRFTLNLGLRYEVYTPWVDKYDRLNTVVPDLNVRSSVFPNAPVGMLFPGDRPRGMYNTDRNNFAPRVGFAWDVNGDGKTAVRAGYGVFFDSFNTDTIAQENPPFVGGRRTFFEGYVADPFGSVGQVAPPAFIDPNAFTFTFPINGFWNTPNENGLRQTYVQSWNLTIQRQFLRDYVMSVAYIGKASTKLIAYRPFNAAIFVPGQSTEANAAQRVPFAPGVYGPESLVLDNSFTGSYHGMQLELNRRFSGGFQLASSYTLSKALDTSSTFSLGGCLANPFDHRASKGRSDWDRRHALVVSGVWTPPVFAAQKGMAGRVLGGWNFSGIVTAQSGSPVTATAGQNRAFDGTFCAGSYHPDIVGQIQRDHSSRADMIGEFFNRSAFALPAIGTYGTAARGMFSGPAFVNTDFAILKDIAVTESARFQLRGEFTNLLNQVNFNNPVASVVNAQYGRINGAQAGRNVQVALKFMW
ncbi:MAG: TonB-dependent receptor [Bryobacterales bacterium]|nr:TonB-dependent receptor [Bryobacterales bacterium]